MMMTPEAKARLSKTIRVLRTRLLDDLGGALQGEYRLGTAAHEAKLDADSAAKRLRLDSWVASQPGGSGTRSGIEHEAAVAGLRGDVVKTAAYTWLHRLVYLRRLEATGLRPTLVATGGWSSPGYQDFRELAPGLCDDETEGYALLLRMVFDELSLDLPGLFASAGLAELVPVPAPTLRAMVEALDDEALASCWSDDMTLGWVYQYWNDPEREALDERLAAGGKVEPHEIASKTQVFTERYMVDWLLHNSLGPLWLATCSKHGWTAEAERDGTLADLEARRVEWRAKRDAGQVERTALMPLFGEQERRWAYYVPQEISAAAIAKAPRSVREIRLLDPAVGSGHFLMVAMDLLVALYREEARHRGEEGQPQWSDRAIVERVLEENLHGIDLDPRAVQIAAAGLWLKAQQIAAGARPSRMNLVASNLRLAGLPEDDPGLVELRQEVERETGIPGMLTDRVFAALRGADHLGSLLEVDAEVERALHEHEARLGPIRADPGGRFDGVGPKPPRRAISTEQARASLRSKLEDVLARHSGRDDLGLRRLDEQLAAGVRFVRMVREGTYDLVVGNPPYQGTAKMADAEYVKEHYPLGKADLYAAFLQRGLALAREGGYAAFVTMNGWMYIRQYSRLRRSILSRASLRSVVDLLWCGFEDMRHSTVAMCVLQKLPPVDRERAVGLVPTPRDERDESNAALARKRAAIRCQEGRCTFSALALAAVPEWPLVYWWTADFLAKYARSKKLAEVATGVRNGLQTNDNARFLRWPWEARLAGRLPTTPAECRHRSVWAAYVKGAAGQRWMHPLCAVVQWGRGGLQSKVMSEWRWGSHTKRVQSEDLYFSRAVAITSKGSVFGGRYYDVPSIFDVEGRSVSGVPAAETVCLLNGRLATEVMSSLNPTIHFTAGDAARLPWVPDPQSAEIFERVRAAFAVHESHREPSVEFRSPGPSPWIHAQAWAQLAVDRPEDAPLPAYVEQLPPEPATDHLSFALGVALGRFSPAGDGVLDPTTADLAHALPAAILFLDGSLPADVPEHDSLAHPATAPLHAAWATHARAITKRTALRDYLRLDFFCEVHRAMYENRPIHWPISSSKRTFVAWINIHRFTAATLRTLLADHLHPALARIDGRIADLRSARDQGDAKLGRAADKHLETLTKARDELDALIVDVTQCAERGPRPPEAKTPPREVDAPYAPDLDDGVMINAAALYPLLSPQWRDPARWWKELATAHGRKDYDWSQLAARYWPRRVDDKCKEDPSLAVAHHRFWRYHPGRAYAWELRLQDELAPTFTIDEPDSDACRERFLAEHTDEAAAIRERETKRRERKAAKAEGGQGARLEDDDEASEADVEASEDDVGTSEADDA